MQSSHEELSDSPREGLSDTLHALSDSSHGKLSVSYREELPDLSRDEMFGSSRAELSDSPREEIPYSSLIDRMWRSRFLARGSLRFRT